MLSFIFAALNKWWLKLLSFVVSSPRVNDEGNSTTDIRLNPEESVTRFEDLTMANTQHKNGASTAGVSIRVLTVNSVLQRSTETINDRDFVVSILSTGNRSVMAPDEPSNRLSAGDLILNCQTEFRIRSKKQTRHADGSDFLEIMIVELRNHLIFLALIVGFLWLAMKIPHLFFW